jgi:hypothetical protein
MPEILVVPMFILFCALVVSGAGLAVALAFALLDRRWPVAKGRDAPQVRAGSRAALRRYAGAWMGSAAVWSLAYLAMLIASDG